ncbi:DUF4019 domain-containing protein [Paremcibacter congregatus]|nr:DUF4019 domain-containing protein [Paremcibacter congregatus]|tara:strand:- start:842 stop:1291 length:450 start_codon:yes stop_codon:yes gene_type:complete
MQKIKRFLLTLSLPLLLLSCSASEGTDIAELAVEEFHASYNAGAYATIYSNTTDAFQQYVSKEKFIRLMQRLKNNLGPHVSSTRISWSVKTDLILGTSNYLGYQTAYEKDKQAKETFEFKIQDGIARLNNFNVASPLLASRTQAKRTPF